MDINFDIRVVNDDGDGVEGIPVFVSYSITHQEDYTDEDGWVHFSRGGTIHGGVRADIFVKSQKVDEQVWIEDGDTFSFTI